MSNENISTDPPRPGRYVSGELNFLDASSPQWRVNLRSSAWQPPTDVYETEEAIVVRVEIAGMREDDFAIQLEGRVLSIRGVRQEIPERRAYHQMEIRFGEFGVEVELLTPILPNQVEAVYSNGFLRVVLPKARPHQVSIQDEQ